MHRHFKAKICCEAIRYDYDAVHTAPQNVNANKKEKERITL